MIQSKSYGLQNETRQYLRRLYAYGRELAPTDVADIDNFVKGLKQLNLWQSSICFLMRSQHNLGTGNTILSLGGEQNVNGALVNSPTWGQNGITFSGTNYITAFLRKQIQTSEISIASVANSTTMAIQNGYPYQLSISTNSYNQNGHGFSIFSNGTSGNTWSIENIQNAVSYSTTSAINNQTSRFNGGRLSQSGFQNYLNGTITTNTTVRNNQIFDRIQICGRWSNNAVQTGIGNFGVGWIGTQSFVMVSLDYVDFSILQQLYKTTIGKGLGLP
jgi:hypothetical protein